MYDSDSKNNSRYKYLGDKKGNCTLQITDLQKKDEATLRFRMEANHIEGHFTDQSGVNITVAGKSKMFVSTFVFPQKAFCGSHQPEHVGPAGQGVRGQGF